jgi:hypothetical protein
MGKESSQYYTPVNDDVEFTPDNLLEINGRFVFIPNWQSPKQEHCALAINYELDEKIKAPWSNEVPGFPHDKYLGPVLVVDAKEDLEILKKYLNQPEALSKDQKEKRHLAHLNGEAGDQNVRLLRAWKK